MVMRKFLISLCLCFFLVSGCAPSEVTPIKNNNIYKPIEEQFFHIGEISKSEKPVPIYLKLVGDNKYETIIKEEATHVCYTSKEFAKIVALNKAYNSQGDILKETTNLVNIKIQKINELNGLINLKQQEVDTYVIMWTNSENSYRFEKYHRDKDNLMHRFERSFLYIVIMSLVVVAL